MKQIYTTLLMLLIGFGAFANVITAVKGSDWTDNKTWSPVGQPKDGDTIIIPAGIKVTLDKNKKFDHVVIMVYGTLRLDNGKLKLDENSEVIIEPSGQLTGSNSNDQVSIGNDLKYKGTMGTLFGYSYANSSTGVYPNGFMLFSLPVHFTGFSVTASGNDIVVRWSTDREINNDHFVVERSTDGSNWKSIASIQGNGTTSISQEYSFIDKNATAATNYYRILQVDINGQQTYSSVRLIKKGTEAAAARIYASSGNTINVDFNSASGETVLVKVFNQNGQLVASTQAGPQAYQAKVAVNTARGMHIVQLSSSHGLVQVQKIML